MIWSAALARRKKKAEKSEKEIKGGRKGSPNRRSSLAASHRCRDNEASASWLWWKPAAVMRREMKAATRWEDLAQWLLKTPDVGCEISRAEMIRRRVCYIVRDDTFCSIFFSSARVLARSTTGIVACVLFTVDEADARICIVTSCILSAATMIWWMCYSRWDCEIYKILKSRMRDTRTRMKYQTTFFSVCIICADFVKLKNFSVPRKVLSRKCS